MRILKELPVCVYMTCCRPAPHAQADAEQPPPPEAPVQKVELIIEGGRGGPTLQLQPRKCQKAPPIPPNTLQQDT